MNKLDLILENIRLSHIEQLLMEAESQDEINRGIQLINESINLLLEYTLDPNQIEIDRNNAMALAKKNQRFNRDLNNWADLDVNIRSQYYRNNGSPKEIRDEMDRQNKASILKAKVAGLSGAGVGSLAGGLIGSNSDLDDSDYTGTLIGAGLGAVGVGGAGTVLGFTDGRKPYLHNRLRESEKERRENKIYGYTPEGNFKNSSDKFKKFTNSPEYRFDNVRYTKFRA